MAYYKVDKKYAYRVYSDKRLRDISSCGHVIFDEKDLTMIPFLAHEVVEMLGLEEFNPDTDDIADDTPDVDNTLPDAEDAEDVEIDNNLPEVEPEITEENESSN